jgi:hypothetical protein
MNAGDVAHVRKLYTQYRLEYLGHGKLMCVWIITEKYIFKEIGVVEDELNYCMLKYQ